MDFIIAGKSNFAPLSDWPQASSWVSVKFKRIYRIRHMILGWLECISNVGIRGGANRNVGRGIKGIIGIFFFHFSGSERSVGKLIRVVHRWRNRNSLILNWLFACGKIRRKLRLFLRGYPRASSFFSLAALRLEPALG